MNEVFKVKASSCKAINDDKGSLLDMIEELIY